MRAKKDVVAEKAYNEKFEVDWLYCSEDKIVVIEVGRTIKLEEPSSAVRNKLHQALYTLIPKLQYVIWYLCEHVNKSSNANCRAQVFRENFPSQCFFLFNLIPNRLFSIFPPPSKFFEGKVKKKIKLFEFDVKFFS